MYILCQTKNTYVSYQLLYMSLINPLLETIIKSIKNYRLNFKMRFNRKIVCRLSQYHIRTVCIQLFLCELGLTYIKTRSIKILL